MPEIIGYLGIFNVRIALKFVCVGAVGVDQRRKKHTRQKAEIILCFIGCYAGNISHPFEKFTHLITSSDEQPDNRAFVRAEAVEIRNGVVRNSMLSGHKLSGG